MSSPKLTTRDRILKASWNLLEVNQGKGVRMSDIAKRAGITRQALYLHFRTRAALLIATTRYVDDVKGVDERLVASRNAASGAERLDAFIVAWGNYIPEIYGIAKALISLKDTDPAAAAAWDDRMQAVRAGCAAAIAALRKDGNLTPAHSDDELIDMLWTLLSVHNWEQLTQQCGWSQAAYIDATQRLARRALMRVNGDTD